MTNQNTYDYLNRLTGRISALNFNYQYNTASQRTKVTLIDGSYWLYSYDALGQLTSGIKYFSDGTPYAGQQFDYNFDTIGNRTSTEAGGDQMGANLRLTSYTNNALNQIVSRNVPGDVDVMGLSLATNTVSVNGTNAYQKWEYYREQMATNNTSAAQWVGINVTAPGQTAVSGSSYIPRTPETNAYDLDGNLTQDGRWTYTWDAENRLVNMTSLTNGPAGSLLELAFAYDSQGRRIQKLVYTNNGSYVAQYTNRYVYDGWNPVAIVNPANSLVAFFVWGLDASGTMQGAGGVGGLLEENLVGNGVQYVAYDGNGNVAALVATNGTVSANYEYGPFGEAIRITGGAAKANPFRFSTKFTDDESALVYYGYRYYNPSTGRWLCRDPKREKGGLNLYVFSGNCPTIKIDILGRDYTQVPGVPHVSDDRHNNYLIFYLQCPKCKHVANVKAEFDKPAFYRGLWLEWVSQELGDIDGYSEADWLVALKDDLDDDFGQIENNPKYYVPADEGNCWGGDVEEHVWMRTRLVSPGSWSAVYRYENDIPDNITGTLSLYQLFTKVYYTCDSCN